jgi:hypothetical protein
VTTSKEALGSRRYTGFDEAGILLPLHLVDCRAHKRPLGSLYTGSIRAMTCGARRAPEAADKRNKSAEHEICLTAGAKGSRLRYRVFKRLNLNDWGRL